MWYNCYRRISNDGVLCNNPVTKAGVFLQKAVSYEGFGSNSPPFTTIPDNFSIIHAVLWIRMAFVTISCTLTSVCKKNLSFLKKRLEKFTVMSYNHTVVKSGGKC